MHRAEIEKTGRRGVALLLLALLLAACSSPATGTQEATATAGTPTQSMPAPPTFTATLLPSATLTPEADWYQPLDASYSVLEYRYGVVENPQARVYRRLQDAVEKNGNFGYLASTPANVAVVGEATQEGHTYYTVYYGWMEAEEVQLLTPSDFRGVLLTRLVEFRFGWVLRDMQSTNAVGTPIREYSRYEVIHEVPSGISNPGYVAIGPDEWLPEDAVALTSSQVPQDAGANTCRFLYVDLAEQTLRVFNECKLVFATLVSTGKQEGWTFPGRFAILARFRHMLLTPPEGSTSVYYQEGVPDFMTFSGDLGFHGAYWHDNFGEPVSHGCVNLSPGDARWLYEWAWDGERVIISSGK